jgi:hypothetical protein
MVLQTEQWYCSKRTADLPTHLVFARNVYVSTLCVDKVIANTIHA